MAAETIEEMIVAMEKRGWRFSSLAQIRNDHAYSCILERKRNADDGHPVFAMSELRPTAREAVAEAWENAQKPLNNPKVAKRVGAPITPVEPGLAQWLNDNIGYKVRLEYAWNANIKSLTGEEDDSDDFL